MTESLKVLVTGTRGLLGGDVAKILRDLGHEVAEIRDEKDVDLRNFEGTMNVIMKHKPDVVVHCAGTHDIDGTERNPEFSYDNLVSSVRNVVYASKKIGAVLLYPGSDYIFDGLKNSAYNETDEPNPLNVYGKAKWFSEKIIVKELSEYFIIRLPILFGAGGEKHANIIYRVYSEIKEGKTIKAPADQVSSCAYTVDIAKGFAKILETSYYGIYHLANEGYCSRYELYKEAAFHLSLPTDKVVPCLSSDLKRPAKRPKYTVLNTSLAEKTFGVKLRNWKKALAECIAEFKGNIQNSEN